MGRLGSFKPTRPRRTAFATAETASSCPTTRLWRVFSSRRSLAASPSSSFFTGIFVQPETISAISSGPTTNFFLLASLLYFFKSFSYVSSISCFSPLIRDASSIFPSIKSCSKSLSHCFIFCSSSSICPGTLYPPRRTLEEASSIKSIALSGRKRSLI